MNAPAFCQGIQHYGEKWPDFDQHAASAVIAEGQSSIADATTDTAAYQTLLAADALRYLTLQVTGSKGSGHPGGFASSAEAHASLMMQGHTNIVTEVGHHAPGFYSSMFLDSSLEEMGIHTMDDMMARFRERHGLLGHLSGAIPGLLAPAGPLGQGQHFAMAGALLYPGKLFPVTIGDGGMGEPYVLNSMMHFNTAFPAVTNFLPVLIWNGYSQEHHSMVSRMSNDEMIAYWKGHGFREVVLIDAKDFDDSGQDQPYVDSTRFSHSRRLAFTSAVLQGIDRAANSALGGTLTVFIIKQLKGAGVHTVGAKSHNLYPQDTLDQPHIIDGLKRRALPPEAWQIVRDNLSRAGGGPAAKTVVTESELAIAPMPQLAMQEFTPADKAVPATAMGALVAQMGQADPRFVVTNADGNEASAMKNINDALKIRHPSTDPLYNQQPDGQVYEPLNEDACAGLAAGLALFGSRALWLSYESFAINGWPVVQTVTQAMAELRRKTPSIVCMFTAGALEQGRNGWTHQRPEIENLFSAMMRNGNVFPLFPCDANCIQAAYEYATDSINKGMVIIASKSPLPVYLDLASSKKAIKEGAATLYESCSGEHGTVVFAVTGDMVLLPVFAAKDLLEAEGYRVRIVAVVNPRALYRPGDVAWDTVSQPDNGFMDDDHFNALFDGDALIAVSGGPSASLEPVLLRTRAPKRDTFCWKRGETTASADEIMAFNGITSDAMVARAKGLL
ncbi:transketolase [Mariprofundus ferrooxydans]|uniref:Transketolase, central region n=1 Tax=Mariprofundus ferrooxydans PV-1 TaxID=314345 RepID=Q0EYX2_9PROT|nr:transketolase [Mariprofundus ferrooxydans]EAU54435.1 Transketolase, central region [Mariprofundus ferrooxydans PV-1]KON48363.1 transketolase [Mariprofundus ferrooxydans]